jgi:hypothetical protein
MRLCRVYCAAFKPVSQSRERPSRGRRKIMGTDRQETIRVQQTHQLMSTLSVNVDWGKINPARAQALIRDPKRAGELFAAFVNRGLDRQWYEENGIVHLTVKSNGWSRARWIEWFKRKGHSISTGAKEMLGSPAFSSAPSGTLYKVAILRGMLWSDDIRTVERVWATAVKHGFANLHPEVLCLICWAFSHDDLIAMGMLHIMGMHEPLPTSCSSARLWFGLLDSKKKILSDCSGDAKWRRDSGFAFADM